MRAIIIFAACLASAAAVPTNPQKIVGGSKTTISQYPNMGVMLYLWEWNISWQACGCTIINTRTILTAAHCPYGDVADVWQVRVGSSYASSGGKVHNLISYVIHPDYSPLTLDNDIAVMRTDTVITFLNDAVQPALIAGPNYNVADNQVVWAAGWGATYDGDRHSEQLQHVQVWTINQNICVYRYAEIGYRVTDNMLCSGWLDVGGRDQCTGDSGGPLYHNNVVIGICSWGLSCGLPRYPGVNVRVSRYTAWIQANA